MNSKKIVSSTTKITSAVFLSVVLIAGTIALSFPSFMIGVQAQSYYGMDDGYGSSDYGNDNRYNSYEQDYERDNGRKSYDNSYKSQYQFYKPDYKPKYSSYDGKDDRRDKSQDSSKSVSINKLNCINTNININGNNTGNINLGNKGQLVPATAEEEGYLSASLFGSEYSDETNNGHKKKSKGFDCTINNNNTNINIVGAGNQTTPEPEPTCEGCFSSLNATEITEFIRELNLLMPTNPLQSLASLCTILEGLVNDEQKAFAYALIATALTRTEGVSVDERNDILRCLQELGLIIPPP